MKLQLKTCMAFIAIAFVLTVSSCTKEGPAGPKGADGYNGTNGVDGNANVKMIVFKNDNGSPVDSLKSARFLINRDINITSAEADSSLVLIYFQTSSGGNTYWYSGNTSRDDYRISSYTSATNSGVKLYMEMFALSTNAYYVTGTSKIIMTQIKVVLAPVNGFSGKREPVDYNDYSSTMKYFGLPE